MAGLSASVNITHLDEPSSRLRHLLHVFASFGYGGVPIRICDVINGLPEGFRHTIVALDGCLDARARLADHTMVDFRSLQLSKYNLLHNVAQVRKLVRQQTPDLLLTYNWGAIECALANRFADICEHIHFESGFGAEEGDGQLWRRSVFRRFALSRASKVVVPSATLMKIAAVSWRIPTSKLQQIPNGVDVLRYSGVPGSRDDSVLDFPAGPKTIIGTVAPLRPEKNVGRLLRAFAALPARRDSRLVIAGDGVEIEQLQASAAALGIAEQTTFLGYVEDVPAVLRAFDVFALSSDTEQMPNSLLQAMAAARPIAAVDVGDVAQIVAPENRALVVPRDDGDALAFALSALAGDPERRERLGRLNQERIKAHYSLDGMVAAYAALFGRGGS